MIRSTRSRKQPESIYRLQEEDYRLKNLRAVETGSALDMDKNGEDGQQLHPSHEMRPRKVARISEDTLSKKGSTNTSKPKTSTDNGTAANADALNATKLWEGQGHTKLGFSAQRFAKILQNRERGAISFIEAKQLLEVNSRRLYDILHVLDGAGLITVDRTSKKSNCIITWNGPLHSPIEESQLLHNQKLHQELIQMNDWMRQMEKPYHQPNTCPSGTMTNDTFDDTKLYITKNELWKQRRGGVDLILAPQPGAVLHVPTTPMTPLATGSALSTHHSTYSFQLVSPTPLNMPSHSSTDSVAYLLEDSGILKSLDLGAPPLPLLASCCSDFSQLHLAPPSLTPSTSDWSFHHRAAVAL
ncbi:hypothetical protein MHU86_13790 [Fragilaria crotonensis]|nr:hypothetical protein MHU86_13790 [Fragilaria crotonensis]